MTAPPVYDLVRGKAPLLISVPHAGTHLPPEMAARMTAAGRGIADTDWHVDKLYREAAEALGASLIVATHARYVVDLNRHPEGRPLYPDRSNTELCPTTTFDQEPIYQPGEAPDADEVAARREAYWQPYHDALKAELDRLKDAHGTVVLYDAHSIRSEVPRFFSGVLPAYNLGTADGQSCAESCVGRAEQILATRAGGDWARDGTFKGGYITRCYGAPERDIHAVQMELAQRLYMQEAPPWTWRHADAAATIPVLTEIVTGLRDWAHGRRAGPQT